MQHNVNERSLTASAGYQYDFIHHEDINTNYVRHHLVLKFAGLWRAALVCRASKSAREPERCLFGMYEY